MTEKKYAKVINKETHEVQVGVGCPDKYYVEIGMKQMDVELAYNGLWYVAGKAPVPPKPTVDDQKNSMRYVRDMYINDIEWRVSRYRDQVEMKTKTTDTHEEYVLILQYIQYLRDYPGSDKTWYKQEPLTFEQWKNRE